MHFGSTTCATLLALAAQLPSPVEAAKPKDAILLSDVESLTFYANRQTTHRRVPAIPQLRCVSARAVCALHAVDTMRCVNQGGGYGGSEDVQWACTASSVPSTLKLGSTDVVCEGYSRADDPYVLKGSCGVEYRLVLTEEGERRYPRLGKGGDGGSGGGGKDVDWAGVVFGVIFLAVLVWIIWSACLARDANNAQASGQQRGRGNGGGGGGGGGGWGGGWGPGGGGGGDGGGRWNDPPPPYPGTGTKPPSEQGWQPGFWSGLGAGTAAGYLAGNRRQQNNYNNPNQGLWGGRTDYGSTWGQRPEYGSRPNSGRGSGSSSSSRSETRQESTGFGSTSRR